MSKRPFSATQPIDIPQLRARATMPPYEPCWCRSGKKFKFCHFRRDRESPINPFEEEQKHLAIFRNGHCSHPKRETCGNRIIQSHTVQRNGGLSAISEHGHVLSVKRSLRQLVDHSGLPPLSKVGIGKASVFPGFCDKHDDALFKYIEGREFIMDARSAFLLSYRAACYEHFTKSAALKSIEVMKLSDLGQPLWKQELIQNELYAYEIGSKAGLRDLEEWKTVLDHILIAEEYKVFHYLIIKLSPVLPIVACGAFYPEFDLKGEKLQVLDDDGPCEGIALNISAFSGATVACLGWTGNERGPADRFQMSLEQTPPDLIADALVRICFFQLENIFLRPSWWENLDAASQDTLQRAVQSGTTLRERRQNDLVHRGSRYAAADVSDQASG